MNRIQPYSEAAPTKSARLEVEQALSQSSTHGAPHTLFAPLHYEKNYAYPLFIWLHGPGDNESQLRRVMPLVSMRNYVAVAPRGTCEENDGNRAGGRYTWRETDEGILLAEQSVVECIDVAMGRFHVAKQRIFLAGFGVGGTMALRIGLGQPDRFAGVASLAGAFPRGKQPLIRINEIRKLPLLLSHGRDSEKYTQDQASEDLRLLHTAGMSLTLRQYPCSDEITIDMLHDLNVWTMEQVTGTESPSRSKIQWRPSLG